MTKRRRPLSAEEKRLWAHVARHVKPMKGKRLLDVPEPAGEAAPSAAPPVRPAAPPPPPARPRAALPPLAAVERKTLQALRRKTRSVEAAIDLHGMRQEEAHVALLGFLHRAQRSGHDIVLVITGKGGSPSPGSLFEERG